MDEVNIEKNEKKDALLIAIEEGRMIVKDPKCTEIFQYGRLKKALKYNIFDRKKRASRMHFC